METDDAVWALVLGAALALISTLVARWASLAYQTRRRREARRADFQRSSLQVRDLLLELSEAMGVVARPVSRWPLRRSEAAASPAGSSSRRSSHSVSDRLVIIAAAVEDAVQLLGERLCRLA